MLKLIEYRKEILPPTVDGKPLTLIKVIEVEENFQPPLRKSETVKGSIIDIYV